MPRHRHQFLDLYCCLPHEFLIAYPQPRLSFYYPEKKKNVHRNTNALERTSSSRLSKCKPKDLLHPYKRSKDHYANDTHTSRRGLINKIMSIKSSDHEIEFDMKIGSKRLVSHHHSSQMADGDKKNETTLENFLDQFQQPRFTNDQECIIEMMDQDIGRPILCKPTSHNQLKKSSDFESFKNSIACFSSSRMNQSTLPLNRTSTWHKLQANMTPSHYNRIQQFQRERQQQPHPSKLITHPVMLSPLNHQSEMDNSQASKVISNITNSGTLSSSLSSSLSIDSSTGLTDSNSNRMLIHSINVDQQILNDDGNHLNVAIPVTSVLNLTHPSATYAKPTINSENEVKLHPNDSFTNVSVPTSPDIPSSQEIENIEEFQPVIEIVSPSQVPSVLLNDILCSFFPTTSTPPASPSSSHNNPLLFHSQHYPEDNIVKTPYILFDNTPDITELLFIDPPPTSSSSVIESHFISENQLPKHVHSLCESIEELCLLIRKLLQHDLTEQKITSLQAIIANQLAILLTYLAMPQNEKIITRLLTKETIEQMTSTNEDNVTFQKPRVLTTGTQTDLEWIKQLNDQISKLVPVTSNNTHFHSASVDDLMELESHKSSSFDTNQEEIIDILPISEKVTSQTELMSASVTLHLPDRRPHHARSDTFIYHIHRYQQYSSSYHQLISFSETTFHSLMNRWSTKEKTKHLVQRMGPKFQHYIELESSNTCLEASTEFTPDFLLTTIDNSKYDDDDDDQTAQFGIDTEKQDYHTDTISLIINKNQDKLDTLTFNSTEKENYDSLELDIEQDNEEHSPFALFDIHQSNQHLNNEVKIEDDDISKSSIAEINSLFLNNSSLSFNDDLVSPGVNQSNDKKHFCQLIESLVNTNQWQVPTSPRKTNSSDVIYEKRAAKIDFKYLKIRSNSSNEINIIGKRVRIKSNPSSRASTPTIKSHSSQEQSRKLSTLNYNNNCNEHINSTQSLNCSTSIVDTGLSSTSIDSLCSLDTDTLDKNSTDQCTILPKSLSLLRNYSESDQLILHSFLPNIPQHRNNLDKTVPSSVIISSHLSDVTGELDSNIALAESVLDMLHSLNNYNNISSTMKMNLLHMCIRQFLIEFDARVCLARKRRKNCKKQR